MDRRQFLKFSGAAAALAGLSWLTPISPRVARGAVPKASFEPDVDIFLQAIGSKVPILPGPATDVWSYQGKVLTGPEETLDLSGRSYLGPIFRLKKGQKVRIRFINLIPEKTIIHWHGLHVPELMDGHPRLAVGPGESYTYEFEVLNRAGTYWYHPHPHGLTGPQVYAGLAGLFIVSDPEEAGLPLPAGRYDLPLVIQDRSFDQNNQLVYLGGGMMSRMTGMLGNRILVNGRPDAIVEVDAATYRLRILNGSNARIYRLAWEDGTPLAVIGTDGGLLERPERKQEVLLSPGERIELWADFSGYPAGVVLSMLSRPLPETASGPMSSPGMMGGMMSGMMGGEAMQYTPFAVVRFKVGGGRGKRLDLPDKLVSFERFTDVDAENVVLPRRFILSMAGMQGLINGRAFQMMEVAPDEMVRLGAQEIWEFDNGGPGMGPGMGMMNMPMPHPMHIHAVQFQILGRRGLTHDAYVDSGWKDTILLLPGESARVIARFAPFEGLYLYHCHNLEHSDGGMMRNFRIKK